MGAVGTRRIFADLAAQGHTPMELERGSMSFKIWRGLKMKRFRVPDILCVSCGVKVESRAKTNLELSMSHSSSDPERGWDYGLDDNDYIAFAVCEATSQRPTDWSVSPLIQYVKVSDFRAAFHEGKAVYGQRKGAQEGFEARVTWPCGVANYEGVVTEITNKRLKYERASDKRTVSLGLEKQGVALDAIVELGEHVEKSQIVTAPVPIHTSFECAASQTWEDYVAQLSSPALHDRYAAAKALAVAWSDQAVAPLSDKARDEREERLVRLEAAATLMKHGQAQGAVHIRRVLASEYDQQCLEATIVLAEVQTKEARQLLVEALCDNEQHPDVRAAAAWAIGEARDSEAMPQLVKAFVTQELQVRAEAARALAEIAREHVVDVAGVLSEPGEEQRAGVAWALSKAADIDVELLLHQCVDDETRRWVAFIIGSQQPEEYVQDIERLRAEDPELYFAATVLWQIATSWTYGLEEY